MYQGTSSLDHNNTLLLGVIQTSHIHDFTLFVYGQSQGFTVHTLMYH